MSSTDDTSPSTDLVAVVDDPLADLLEEVREALGDAVVDVLLKPGDDLWVRVRTDSWVATGEALKAIGFDYFCFLSVMDWLPSPFGKGEDDPTEPPPERETAIRPGVCGGDTRFQLLARLSSSTRHLGLTLKVDVPDVADGESPEMPTWVGVYAGANWHEREAWEMFGIRFAGHPTCATSTCRRTSRATPCARTSRSWPGWSSRGRASSTWSPCRPTSTRTARQRPLRPRARGEVAMSLVTDRDQLRYIAGQAADARVNIELETEGMTLNIGPQHPATHGTLRIVARLDGEQVIWAEPVAGYMHRGYEKLTEVRTFPQVTTLINRIDWLGSFANEVPFILACEKLMEVEAPPRAQHIRTILFELSRIANVSLFLGDLGVQLGALTPVFYAFRDREYVLNLIEGATGGRFHPNFDRIGGIKDDLPKGWIDETKAVMKKMRRFCDEMETLLIGNEIYQARTRGIGVIPPEVALSYGLSGANLRGSGIDWDLRRDQQLPMAWDKCDWKVWTHPDGDVFARVWVRLQETREATKIVDQLLDTLPSGPIMAKVPRIIKVPEGEAWVSTENPLGEMGYYVVSRGDIGPFRVKIRTASFNNISIASWVLRGVFVPDVIAILASLYFILGDIDR